MGPLPAFAVVLAAVASVLVSGPAAAGPESHSAEPPSISSRSLAFSPNGDGVKDLAPIRYFLAQASRVSVAVFGRDGEEFRIPLGSQSAGTHTWVWDGRIPGGGRVLPRGGYSVQVRTADGTDSARVALDVGFHAAAPRVLQRFGRRRSQTPRVFPRTTVVRDSIALVTDRNQTGKFRRAHLQVRDRNGRVLMRRDLIKRPMGYVDSNGYFQRDPAVWEARDSRGRALPPGLYFAVVEGVDHAGNAGTSEPLLIRVSRQPLQWVEVSRSLMPLDSRLPPCDRNRAESCSEAHQRGTVSPSTHFPGGLSLRGATCTECNTITCVVVECQRGVRTYHQVTVADAVRGIDSYRVAFAGAPTHPDEADRGLLAIWHATVTSSSTGQTPWLSHGPHLDGAPWMGDGLPGLLPSVWWEMSTSGDDAFDVGNFVVDVRYLAVAD